MTDFHHIDDRIDDYFDKVLPNDEQAYFEEHLASCPDCRKLVDSYRVLFSTVENLPHEISPGADVWNRIEAGINSSDQQAPRTQSSNLRLVTYALATAAAVAFLALLYTLTLPRSGWDIVPVAGQPLVNGTTLSAADVIRPGHSIRTDGESRATVTVGEIGTIDIAPSTSVDLLSTAEDDHRFKLNGGEIHATINAPPRIFFVETPSALAIDLGCEYTLRVDSAGVSFLHVQFGYVELDHARRSSVIPEGFRAISDPLNGPTVPFDEESSDEFIDALVAYDLLGDVTAIESLLANASTADATTLWLLLDRSAYDLRESIYRRMVELVGEPEGVTMSGVLVDGDLEMSLAWQQFLGLDLTLMTFDGI